MTKGIYDAQDRLTNYGTTEYQYNANGDLLEKIEHSKDTWWHSWIWNWDFSKNGDRKTQYEYDAFGNLLSVTLPDQRKIEYVIDGQNRRVGKMINGKMVQEFVYQNQTQIAAELDGNGKLVRRFVYGEKSNIPDYLIENGKEYRIISDQVGTPKSVVDVATGRTVEVYNFDEFGIALDLSGCSKLPFGFAGGLYDIDTGLVRFGARDYNPEIGRWTSKDPLLFGGGSTNLYSYAINDPINFVDLTGKGLDDVNWTNVFDGTVLVLTGGGAIFGSAVSSITGPLAVVGAAIGAAAVVSGGVLIINELNNLFNGPPATVPTTSVPISTPAQPTTNAQSGLLCQAGD